MTPPGQIVILNGAPRSGKSSIAAAIQAQGDGVWINLGVDGLMAATPPRYRPGIGLRPGGERPDLEDLVRALYAALYDSVAALSRQGLQVVVDVGHHESYSRRLDTLGDGARRLAGLPVLFVGVRCPLAVILKRRAAAAAAGAGYATRAPGGPVPEAVLRWQEAVHAGHEYDLELDTAQCSAVRCAERIRRCLATGDGPRAFQRLAKG